MAFPSLTCSASNGHIKGQNNNYKDPEFGLDSGFRIPDYGLGIPTPDFGFQIPVSESEIQTPVSWLQGWRPVLFDPTKSSRAFSKFRFSFLTIIAPLLSLHVVYKLMCFADFQVSIIMLPRLRRQEIIHEFLREKFDFLGQCCVSLVSI